MNHSSTVASVTKALANWTQVVELSQSSPNGPVPFIFGETNSLYNEGKPGLSNSFGATLWGLDFNLYCASQSVRRVHMHQGTNYRYASWQPIQTVNESIGTKAPYYGNIAVASFMGDLTKMQMQVVEIPMPGIYQAAYAGYVNGKLAKLMAIQMNEYNSTTGTYTSPDGTVATGARPIQTFGFKVPAKYASVKAGTVQRLMANGSDAITGITFGGYSYNYELQNGLPVKMDNVTAVESLSVGKGGVIQIQVPYSSAAMVAFM